MHPVGNRTTWRLAKGMAEKDEIELEHRVDLYKFYIDSYMKGILLFLGFAAILFKSAFDTPDYRTLFAGFGIACSVAVLIPFLYGCWHAWLFAKDFNRLAKATGTEVIGVSPFVMLISVVGAFWLIVVFGWVYLLKFM